MQIADVNGVALEYEMVGSGEPVLLISSALADGFAPLLRHRELSGHRLIHYHRRGWVGSTRTPGPVSIRDHAKDAAALLDFLGVERAHVAGHSSGAAVAVQLALDEPDRVHSLVLLELTLLSLPHGQEFLAGAGPVFEAYERGEPEQAFAAFMSAVSGLDWDACRGLLEERAPGTVAQAIADAETFFGVELPSSAEWTLEPERAGTVRQPVLSVVGSDTLPLWVEVADFLRTHVPAVEDCPVPGAGHLLHLQQPDPVARGIRRFVERHAIIRGETERDPARHPS